MFVIITRSEAGDVEHGLGKGLRGLLRQVVTYAPNDRTRFPG